MCDKELAYWQDLASCLDNNDDEIMINLALNVLDCLKGKQLWMNTTKSTPNIAMQLA